MTNTLEGVEKLKQKKIANKTSERLQVEWLLLSLDESTQCIKNDFICIQLEIRN